MSAQGTRDDHWITVYARVVYANYAVALSATGIHLFMALYGLSVFLETPKPLRTGRKRYIWTSFAITVLFGVCASLDAANYFQELFASTSASHFLEIRINNLHNWNHLAVGAQFGTLVLLGEALLVYRCYVICVEYWWVAILPAATSLSAFVLFQLSIFVTSPKFDTARVSSASSLLTVSTNIVVTSLITFHLLRARRSLSKLLPSKDMGLYTGIVAVLIESAVPVTVFGIIQAVLSQTSNRTEAEVVGLSVFDGLFSAFCALSPHMIIFRVTTGRSFTKFPSSKDGALSNPIQFAHQSMDSSFNESTFGGALGRHSDSDPGRDVILNGPVEEKARIPMAIHSSGQTV